MTEPHQKQRPPGVSYREQLTGLQPWSVAWAVRCGSPASTTVIHRRSR
ncbi:hypothetical protein I552_2745 [Mycobacterium xenopi 3993]|nr:hypothetical protein I552_2745 [Mycobacterium xenopi 3993]